MDHKEEQKIIDTAVFTTVFESITAIMLNTIHIDDMKKMMKRLNQWLSDHEESMRRK